MQGFDPQELKKLSVPLTDSHKGQNGKLMVIGGSHLFHAAALWALQISSKIVDMVFYSSVPENNEIVQKLKEEFRNGIIVPRNDIERYIAESDVILIGPGMLRADHDMQGLPKGKEKSLAEINALPDEGEQSYYLTRYLIGKYPHKKWVIDAGALQMLTAELLLSLNGNVVITPHLQEFERVKLSIKHAEFRQKIDTVTIEEQIKLFSKEYHCIVLMKGEEDIVCSPEQCLWIPGGNAGMTKGGTGDVLAGLVASLATKNEMFLAAAAGSYLNKKAGEALFTRVGYYFNASDLVEEIPVVMKQLLF
jgi:NAD(P)H-hydrate epimerase